MSEPRAIKIAITAMGGQGGGVLAGWIVALGERAGMIAQSTSVPGVAQRTGATIYYVELFPADAAKEGRAPVLALMPSPGDVDIVIAAEFMEAGRAIMRGLVSKQTTLIASSHRDYAIAEKIEMGDGRRSTDSIRSAAEEAAGRFFEADMAKAATEAGAVISAVLLGALAGSGALPVSREIFEETIRKGRAVEANLRGFAAGYDIAANHGSTASAATSLRPAAGAPSPAVAPLLERMRAEFAPETHSVIREGLKRCVDYQDVRYASDYLDRLADIRVLDSHVKNWRLTALAAKHLALWMAFEDTVRVADLKTRASRFARFREDVRAAPDQIVDVYEFMHPRVEEVCDLLPPRMAKSILNGRHRRGVIERLLGEKGRRVPTTKLRGFLMLRALASLRFMRRSSFRFVVEQERIGAWLEAVRDAAPGDYELACEIAALQRLIKGYGDTHARGLKSFNAIMAALPEVRAESSPALALASLKDAALKDEEGRALGSALARLNGEREAA